MSLFQHVFFEHYYNLPFNKIEDMFKEKDVANKADMVKF